MKRSLLVALALAAGAAQAQGERAVFFVEPKDGAVDQLEKIMHFGTGRTETMVKLAPGRYTLPLQLGDGGRNSLGAEARSPITVTVQ